MCRSAPSIPNFPKGTLKRFHPDITEVVDVTQVPDQMKIFDTLSEAKVTLIDVRAGLLSTTLAALRDIGFLESVKRGQIQLGVFHIVGSSIASLNEIADIAPFVADGKYYLVKNFINETSFFDWDQTTYDSYFKKVKDAVDITIPKLNEMAYEQVELASVPFVTFIANKGPKGDAANYSFVLRGYVRHWLGNVWAEFDRVKLPDLVSPAVDPAGSGTSKGERSAAERAGGGNPRTDAQRTKLTPAGFAAMARPKSIYIVCSPRQRVGKTLIARALTEFVLADGRSAVAFDLNPNNAALYGFLPRYAALADLSTTRGQMALFDELISEDEVAKVIDLGDESFEKFFTLLRQLGLVDEAQAARHRGGHPVHRRPRSALGKKLCRYLPRLASRMALVPVHNEQIASIQSYMEQFPEPGRGRAAVRIPILSPFLKSIVDKPGFSFDDYLERHTAMRTELHEWIDRSFMEFRELELRLLLRDLKIFADPKVAATRSIRAH